MMSARRGHMALLQNVWRSIRSAPLEVQQKRERAWQGERGEQGEQPGGGEPRLASLHPARPARLARPARRPSHRKATFPAPLFVYQKHRRTDVHDPWFLTPARLGRAALLALIALGIPTLAAAAKETERVEKTIAFTPAAR